MVKGRRGSLEIHITEDGAQFKVRILDNSVTRTIVSEVFTNPANSIEEAKAIGVFGVATLSGQTVQSVSKEIIWTDAEVTAD